MTQIAFEKTGMGSMDPRFVSIGSLPTSRRPKRAWVEAGFVPGARRNTLSAALAPLACLGVGLAFALVAAVTNLPVGEGQPRATTSLSQIAAPAAPTRGTVDESRDQARVSLSKALEALKAKVPGTYLDLPLAPGEVPALDPFLLLAALDPSEGQELTCLAQNIYFEARSEPDTGKLAVGHVVLNRVASKRFPGGICAVVRQGGYAKLNRCQFSWWCDGKSVEVEDFGAWSESLEIAGQVYLGRQGDPTEGALWYHADYVTPRWSKDLKRGPKIGRHIFYQSPGSKPRPQVAAVPDLL